MNFLLDPAIALYTALAVALSVWIGVFIFLWRVDSAARELRRRLDDESPARPAAAPRATLEVRGGRTQQPVSITEPKAE
ncbi:MAG: hypothetical protein HXY39_04395 [Chloroflexi bacterium]|nr:hypothetical protein [Chloroflexota bacterium]